MLTICTENKFIPEKRYIFEVLISDILGLKFELQFHEKSSYLIVLNNKKIVEFEDEFFSKMNSKSNYLSEKNIPIKTDFTENNFIVENDIPVIFGNNSIDVSPNQIHCGIDIFASSFFMLTRWEEFVVKKRDKHDRFSAYDSLAFRNNFLDRPVVNEYVEMLWNMLGFLGFSQNRKPKKYEVIFTHDIDFLFRGRFRWSFDLARKFLKTFNFKQLIIDLTAFIRGKDPYDTYEYFMSKSESVNAKSHFYFMSEDNMQYGTKYYLENKRFSSIVNEISERGHVVGFHPGYKTYKNPEIWKKEKMLLEQKAGVKIKEGRQHFLMMEIPSTLNLWDEMGMEYDSTLGYADEIGYRCGTGDEYYLFDFINRKKLNLIERPLIIMDVTLFNLKIKENKNKIFEKYIKVSKKYNMKLTLLFHNSSLSNDVKELYSKFFT